MDAVLTHFMVSPIRIVSAVALLSVVIDCSCNNELDNQSDIILLWTVCAAIQTNAVMLSLLYQPGRMSNTQTLIEHWFLPNQ